jgi:hypothetical protein
MTTPTPVPVPGPLIEAITWDGLATILAALLATVIAIIGYSFQQSMARKERLATIYSEALRAVEDYLEAPYLVGRRDGSSSARQNVTSTISEIQSRLSYYCALLEIHAPSQISSAYGDLVRVARSEAGPLMSAAWKAKPTRKDRDVPLGKRFTRTKSDHARRVFITEIQRSEGKRRG